MQGWPQGQGEWGRWSRSNERRRIDFPSVITGIHRNPRTRGPTTWRTNPCSWIAELCVDPKWQRMGIGSTLINQVDTSIFWFLRGDGPWRALWIISRSVVSARCAPP
ncbi:MAG: GNAT family N-acetyltransferase [Hyphomicrobium sp.]|nr:GNAT family N-acetyltransferase [Hyphomicrobium sp.]